MGTLIRISPSMRFRPFPGIKALWELQREQNLPGFFIATYLKTDLRGRKEWEGLALTVLPRNHGGELAGKSYVIFSIRGDGLVAIAGRPRDFTKEELRIINLLCKIQSEALRAIAPQPI